MQVGQVVNERYRVLRPLTRGRHGWNFLALELQGFRTHVVLVPISQVGADNHALIDLMANVRNEHVVSLFDVVDQGGVTYAVARCSDGKTIPEMQAAEPLTHYEIIELFLRILPGFQYLHENGIAYRAFNSGAALYADSDAELIDISELALVSEPAPEDLAARDLLAVGRTLAELLLPTLYSQERFPRWRGRRPPWHLLLGGFALLERYESLHRFLLKAGADDLANVFESADAMAGQLAGVMAEMRSIDDSQPIETKSNLFPLGFDFKHEQAAGGIDPGAADYRNLPLPALDKHDPAYANLQSLIGGATRAEHPRTLSVLAHILSKHPDSYEARLWHSHILTDAGDFGAAAQVLDALEAEDGWTWKSIWFRGCLHLAQGKAEEAHDSFDRVYSEIPGEMPPKLAVAMSLERAGQFKAAKLKYDFVSSRNPWSQPAIFGLARCQLEEKDRHGALVTLDRGQYPDAALLMEKIRVWTSTLPGDPSEHNFRESERIARALNDADRLQAECLILETAVGLIRGNKPLPGPEFRLLGHPFEERPLRFAWEACLMQMASLAKNRDEKHRLIEQAERIRPRTWT